MPIVNVRELSRSTSKVIGSVVRTRRPALVTRAGRPVALVTALDPDDLEDWILANAPEFVRGMRQADKDLAAGRTISLEDFLAGQARRRRRGVSANVPRKRRGPRRE